MAKKNDIASLLAFVPPFPQIALEVLDAIRNPLVSVGRLTTLVEKDVALTTAVLKLANSGLYGRRHSVASVRAAFPVLGVESFSQAIMRASVKDFVGGGMAAPELNLCWAHSVATSEIARRLVGGLSLSPDIALSAGLLHDIGRFGLAIAAPAKHTELLSGGKYFDPIEAERELFGIDHTEAGRILADQFCLPDEIRVCAGRHHDPVSGCDVDMLSVVGVACRIATAVGFQVVPTHRTASLEDVIAEAPFPLRAQILPNAEAWRSVLLQTLAA